MGLALVWKPSGIGSQDCLARFKREVLGFKAARGKSEIGHTGTLDPFAEGILLVGWKEGTKLLAPLQGLAKSYRAEMQLGSTSSTLDDTSELIYPTPNIFVPLSESFHADAQGFLNNKVGAFEQIPPAFSAVHVNGKRAYEWARQGVSPELKARRVEILSAEHQNFEPQTQRWTFQVSVSAGTYIRCLARDWGLELSGFAGHLRGLRRFAVGPFAWNQNAVATSELSWKALQIKDFSSIFESILLDERSAKALIQNGQWQGAPNLENSGPLKSRPLLALGPGGRAVAWIQPGGQRIGRVFLQDPFEL